MPEPRSHDAPESASGFFFQLERALFRLATSTSVQTSVGVETDDDVAVRVPGAPGVMEQDKLSDQESGHPFQNRNKGLWNTLLIWLQVARDGEEHHRAAELHLVTNRPVPRSALAYRMGQEAKSDADMDAWVKELRQMATDPSESMADLMKKVCDFTDSQISSVIRRIRLFDAGSGSEGPALRETTMAALHVPPEVDAEAVVQALLGWMQDTLREAWRRKAAGWIDRAAFDRQLDAIVRNERAVRRRERAEHLVPVTEEQRKSARSSPFVERLIEVDVEEEDVLRAVDCYLRFSTESFRLAEEGDIVPSEWANFFSHLRERWRSISRRVIRNRAQRTDEQVGQEILFQTAEGEYLAPLGSRPTEHFYFTTGGYHRLADRDQVWWHPGYAPTREEES